MKSGTAFFTVAAALMMATATYAVAAEKDKFDLGKQEFQSRCAMCHGRSGKGDGDITDLLKKAPSDLTLLAKKNGGVFPFQRAYAVISGREVVTGHGQRDMPIWGDVYSTEKMRAAEHYIDVPYDMEMYARMRMLSLIDYLHRFQSR